MRPEIVVLWIVAALLKQFCTTNNLNDANRFLYSKDSKNARMAALLAVDAVPCRTRSSGSFPPMAAAILYPDLSAVAELKALGSKASDGAYVADGHALPCPPG